MTNDRCRKFDKFVGIYILWQKWNCLRLETCLIEPPKLELVPFASANKNFLQTYNWYCFECELAWKQLYIYLDRRIDCFSFSFLVYSFNGNWFPYFFTSPNQKWDLRNCHKRRTAQLHTQYELGQIRYSVTNAEKFLDWRRRANHICYKRSALLNKCFRWNNFNDTNEADREPVLTKFFMNISIVANIVSNVWVVNLFEKKMMWYREKQNVSNLDYNWKLKWTEWYIYIYLKSKSPINEKNYKVGSVFIQFLLYFWWRFTSSNLIFFQITRKFIYFLGRLHLLNWSF